MKLLHKFEFQTRFNRILIMKKIFFGIALGLLIGSTATAQTGRMGAQQKERIKSFKIAFFTEKLQLTPDESKEFWPLFDQFENEREGLRGKYNLRGKKLELMSDEEVGDFVMNQLEMEQEMVKIRKDYVLRFMKVIPIRKVAMLQRIETEFKKQLLKEIRERRQKRSNMQGHNKK